MYTLSKYNLLIDVDDYKTLLYNNLTKKYIVISSALGNENFLDNLLTDANIDLFKLVKYGILVEDCLDERERIRYFLKEARHQSDCCKLVIQPTLDCNLRCTYCYETHKKDRLNDKNSEILLNFFEKLTHAHKKIVVSWFGGEPLLEVDRIVALSEKFKNLCETNNCCYDAYMTTNGYLLSDGTIDKLSNCNIRSYQITLDGSKNSHNKKRPLINGKGTYEVIHNNILNALRRELKITLRVNIDENNLKDIDDLILSFPKEYCKMLIITLANLFQSKKPLSLFHAYKKLIKKGYRYYNSKPNFNNCEATGINSYTIQPDLRIAPCSVGAEKGIFFGYINKHGDSVITNESYYYIFHNHDVVSDANCRECVELPTCKGGCMLAKVADYNSCTGHSNDGLTKEQNAILHYMSDQYAMDRR